MASNNNRSRKLRILVGALVTGTAVFVMIIAVMKGFALEFFAMDNPPRCPAKDTTPQKDESNNWANRLVTAIPQWAVSNAPLVVPAVTTAGIALLHWNEPKVQSFPANPGVSPSLYSLVEQQHQNRNLQDALLQMKNSTPSKYKKTLCYFWYLFPHQFEGPSDPANPKTAIKNEEELKAALNPSLLGPEFRDQRAAKIDEWIGSIRFTADALNAENWNVIVSGDVNRLLEFIRQNGEYPMIKDGIGLISDHERRFQDAFQHLVTAMHDKREKFRRHWKCK